MAKKLSYDQIAEVNKGFDETAQKLKEVVKSAVKITKYTPLYAYENIEKVLKGLDAVKQSVQGLDKINKKFYS